MPTSLKKRLKYWLHLVSLGALIAGILYLAAFAGALHGMQETSELSGLRDSGDYTRSQEIAFIYGRIPKPLVPPEWIAGQGMDLEENWWIYEIWTWVSVYVMCAIVMLFTIARLVWLMVEKKASCCWIGTVQR